MPNSRVRVKVPLDEALNYYNKVYDKKTNSMLSDGFDIALYNFLGARSSYRNQIKSLLVIHFGIFLYD